jgi:hypothetical protein
LTIDFTHEAICDDLSSDSALLTINANKIIMVKIISYILSRWLKEKAENKSSAFS